MTKIEQMDELIKKYQEDVELQKEIVVVLQAEDPEDTTKADQWLTDHGYEFTIRDLVKHLEEGIPLSDAQLEAVAGGKGSVGAGFTSGLITTATALVIGVTGIGGLVACVYGASNN